MAKHWQESQNECAPVGASQTDQTDVFKGRERPFAILLLALFQICRCLYVAGVVFHSLLLPNAGLTTIVDTKAVIFVFARQNLFTGIPLIILPFVAAYLCVTGIGLFRLKKWARDVLMVASGATILLWARGLLLDSAFIDQMLPTELQRQTVYVFMCVDTMIGRKLTGIS